MQNFVFKKFTCEKVVDITRRKYVAIMNDENNWTSLI